MVRHRTEISARRAAMLFAGVLAASTAPAFDVRTGDISKDNPAYVRVLVWNVFRNFPEGSATQNAAFDRVLAAIAPDVICLQEIPDESGQTENQIAANVVARLNATLGGSWSINTGNFSDSGGFIRNGLASRWPLSQTRDDTTPASEIRGVTMGLVDLPNATYASDLFAMSIHFKSGTSSSDIARRRVAADAVAAWFGDLRTAGGSIALAPGTPFFVAGDTNFNSSADAAAYGALLTGDIADNGTYGPDIKGDWDGTDMTDPVPPEPNTFSFATHDFSSTSRLDRLIYTDSVAAVVQCFVLDTTAMTPAQLAEAGLQAGDTTSSRTSDHRPLVYDFALGGVRATEPMPGSLFITEFIADPSGSDSDREWFEVYNPTFAPVDMDGWTIRSEGTDDLHLVDAGGPLAIPPRTHAAIGRSTDRATNGNAPIVYGYGPGVDLSNSTGDSVELYRGGVKIDGIRFNGGAPGMPPLNVDWGPGPQPSGVSRIMTGDYRSRRTEQFSASTTMGPGADAASPGACNDFSPCGDDAWLLR